MLQDDCFSSWPAIRRLTVSALDELVNRVDVS